MGAGSLGLPRLIGGWPSLPLPLWNRDVLGRRFLGCSPILKLGVFKSFCFWRFLIDRDLPRDQPSVRLPFGLRPAESQGPPVFGGGLYRSVPWFSVWPFQLEGASSCGDYEMYRAARTPPLDHQGGSQ